MADAKPGVQGLPVLFGQPYAPRCFTEQDCQSKAMCNRPGPLGNHPVSPGEKAEHKNRKNTCTSPARVLGVFAVRGAGANRDDHLLAIVVTGGDHIEARKGSLDSAPSQSVLDRPQLIVFAGPSPGSGTEPPGSIFCTPSQSSSFPSCDT